MVWHYHDDDIPGPAAKVELNAKHLERGRRNVTITHYRIDQDHSNSYAAWQKLGSPITLDEEQYAQVEKAGKLAQVGQPQQITFKDGSGTVTFTLPRQGVSLLVFDLRS
jgi:xylan 1,4-beta-xylosidase